MTPVNAVLFDYGLVLSGPADPAAWEAMKRIVDTKEERFHEAYWAPRHPYDRGELTGAAYWDAVAAHLGKALTGEERDELLDLDIALWTQPNREMIAWAAALQRAGVRTGILSNIGDAMEAGILPRCPWIHDFPHHTFSHRLRLAKPEAAIYEHAIAGLGVEPSHILFVDDREENIAAAHRAGMQAIQYTEHAAFVAEMEQRGLASLLAPEVT